MKKALIKKTCFFVIALIYVFSISSAATLSINPSKNVFELNEVVSINYYVSFTRTTSANISIGISSKNYNLTIFNESMNSQVKNETITWNVNKTPAGEYELYLKVFPLESSEQKSSEVVIIKPTALLNATYDSSPVFIFSEEGSKIIKIKNEGNILLNVVPEFVTTPLSEITPEPATFNLPISGEKTINVKIKKAPTDYSFTLKFKGTNPEFPNNVSSVSILMNVIKPNANISWSVGKFVKKENNTIIPINFSNYGNFNQNVSLIIRTFSTKKITEFKKIIPLEKNTNVKKNITISSTDKIFYIGAKYLNENNSTKEEFKKYPVFFGIILPDTILNLIILIYSNKSIRGIFVSVIVVILLITIFKVMKKIFFFSKKRK